MAIRLRDIANKGNKLAPGHRLCAGCAESIIMRQFLSAIDDPIVIATATGCTEVATSVYPYTSWSLYLVVRSLDSQRLRERINHGVGR